MGPDDEKLAREEARQGQQHEAVKSKVSSEVQTEITRNAERARPAEDAQTKALASELKQKAVSEVAAREAEIGRGKAIATISQVVDYLFYLNLRHHRPGDCVGPAWSPPVKRL